MGFDSIFVLGAGGIGSIYGALLSRKYDVTLVGNKEHVDAVNSKGLLVSGELSETFKPKADTEIRKVPPQTLILLTTKAHESAKAVEKAAKSLREDTVILILQNGLGNEEVVRRVVGGKIKVLRGITTMAAEFFNPGQIRFWHGKTTIERDETAEKIAENFNSCGLKTTLSSDIKQEIWSKLVINSVINPLTAIFQVRNREICAATLEVVRHRIVDECVAVGKTQGIRFERNLAERIDSEIGRYSNFSSMCQDVMKRKKTEIDFLNGKIVELGKKNGTRTTVNETIVCMIKFMEEKNELPRDD